MNIYLLIIILILLLFLSRFTRGNNKKESNYLKTFRNNLKSKSHIRKKILNSYSDFVVKDPNKNITINSWDKGEFLLEKANIHKTRLSKYGMSKLNGQIFYKGPRGGVYTLSEEGKKKYV